MFLLDSNPWTWGRNNLGLELGQLFVVGVLGCVVGIGVLGPGVGSGGHRYFFGFGTGLRVVGDTWWTWRGLGS